MLTEKQLQQGKLLLAKGYRRAMECKADSLSSIYTQEDGDQWWCSAHFFLKIHSRIPKPMEQCCPPLGGYFSMVIIVIRLIVKIARATIQLAVKISHHCHPLDLAYLCVHLRMA